MLRLLAVAALLGGLLACGIKGSPRPPKRTFIPEAVAEPDAGCCQEAK